MCCYLIHSYYNNPRRGFLVDGSSIPIWGYIQSLALRVVEIFNPVVVLTMFDACGWVEWLNIQSVYDLRAEVRLSIYFLVHMSVPTLHCHLCNLMVV